MSILKGNTKYIFCTWDSVTPARDSPVVTDYIEAKFCGMQQGLALLHNTKFQAFSFNIVGLLAGESPANVTES